MEWQLVTDLLPVEDLPPGFWYPPPFVRVVELGLTNLEPWQVLDGAALRVRKDGLAQRFPARQLIPFAARQDNDDVACWDLVRGSDQVFVIHDFASPGWEGRDVYPDFYAWLRQAVEDLIDFG
jgi:hypothetical protein